MSSLPATKTCPVTGKSGEYHPPAEGDLRSVCPAINTMANHGYIRRDGKGITPWMMAAGLRACYGLSTPLSLFLTIGGWFLIKRYALRALTLADIGLHGGVEHDASVVHRDCPAGQKDAPIEIIPELVDEFTRNVKDALVTNEDIVETRIRRERASPPLDPMHAEIARGEMAIILGVWARSADGVEGVPLPWMKLWLGQERLPEGWRPDHTETLRSVVKRATALRTAMNKMKKEETEAAKKR
ncbi:Chloroperoxidase [Roridomyces roridus]|uniref:Chloroperoxidase n=1 Tax=Roridomyces roridus TaxID=1738132 RepID=A0AAD7BDV5_9AGAR|nr:Chloroperoxidase [Roridomyces roridus]